MAVFFAWFRWSSIGQLSTVAGPDIVAPTRIIAYEESARTNTRLLSQPARSPSHPSLEREKGRAQISRLRTTARGALRVDLDLVLVSANGAAKKTYVVAGLIGRLDRR